MKRAVGFIDEVMVIIIIIIIAVMTIIAIPFIWLFAQFKNLLDKIY
jgi:hypothetical protein